MQNLFHYCEELGLPVTIHIAPEPEGYYGIVDELSLPRLEKMLKKFPNLKILGHSQPFWSEIGDNNSNEVRNKYVKGEVKNGRLTELLREYGNLCCDISAGSGANALMRDRDHAARFIEEFADRLLYGFDYTMTCNTHPYEINDFYMEMAESGYISYENYYKIVRGNALKLFGIKDN